MSATHRSPNPCADCLAGDHEACTRVGCWGCPAPHAGYGVAARMPSLPLAPLAKRRPRR